MRRNTLTAWAAATLFLLAPAAFAAPSAADDAAALAALQSDLRALGPAR